MSSLAGAILIVGAFYLLAAFSFNWFLVGIMVIGGTLLVLLSGPSDEQEKLIKAELKYYEMIVEEMKRRGFRSRDERF